MKRQATNTRMSRKPPVYLLTNVKHANKIRPQCACRMVR